MAQWVTMRDAAASLNKSTATISRLATKGVIQAKPDPTDNRVKLVDLDELRRVYAVRSRISTERKAVSS